MLERQQAGFCGALQGQLKLKIQSSRGIGCSPLIGGFILLVAGGDLLVRGAVQVASRFGVSPLVIGLTLVGFGTSTPELSTSVQAALIGAPGIAYASYVYLLWP